MPFVYDDLGNIVTNRALEEFKFGELGSYTGTRSLPGASMALNYRVGGLNVFGYHAVNWFIHIINGILIYWLSIALAKLCYPGLVRNTRVLFALFVSLVFVCHPLATEAVTYVVQRNVSMTVMFYVLALATYVQFRVGGRKWWGALSLIATLLAMHSKQIAFTIPVAIVWMELCFFTPKIRFFIRRLPYLLPWLLLLIYLPWRMGMLNFLLLMAGSDTGGTVSADVTGSVDVAAAMASGITPLSRGVYLLTQFGVLLKYLQLLIFPVGQSIDHDYRVQETLFSIQPIIGLAVIAALLALTVWLWPRRRMMSFGIGFFFIGMVIESSVLPLLEVVAEYRLYLPLVGFALVAGDLLMLLHIKIKHLLTTQVVAVLIVLVLTVITFQRNVVWNDPILLWQDAVAKAPEKARPRNNLGTLLLEQGKYGEAADQFTAAIEIDPNYAHAHNNLGTAYGKLGLLDEAEREYQRVIELNPNIITASINLSIIYINQGKWDKAAGQLKEVIEQFEEEKIKSDPRMIGARILLGVVYVEQQRFIEAAEQYEKVLDGEPSNETARTNLELVRAMLRR